MHVPRACRRGGFTSARAAFRTEGAHRAPTARAPRGPAAGAARTLEVRDTLGVTGDLMKRGVPRAVAVRDGNRVLARLTFAGLPTPVPDHPDGPAVRHRNGAARPAAGARLRALGCDVHRPYEVAAAGQDADGVTLTTANGETLRADCAHGMRSAVREAAGIGFTGSAYAQSFVLAGVAMAWRPGPAEVPLNLHSAGHLVVALLPHGRRYRVVAIVDEAPHRARRRVRAGAARRPRTPRRAGGRGYQGAVTVGVWT